MLDTAARAARKPARGGVRNLLCIAEPTETLADELGAIANRVSIILPWSALLRAVGLPEISFLSALRRLCASNATVEIVFSYDEPRDAVLPDAYENAGFRVTSIETIPQSDLRCYETTWAARLAFGRPREVWRLRLIATTFPEGDRD